MRIDTQQSTAEKVFEDKLYNFGYMRNPGQCFSRERTVRQLDDKRILYKHDEWQATVFRSGHLLCKSNFTCYIPDNQFLFIRHLPDEKDLYRRKIEPEIAGFVTNGSWDNVNQLNRLQLITGDSYEENVRNRVC